MILLLICKFSFISRQKVIVPMPVVLKSENSREIIISEILCFKETLLKTPTLQGFDCFNLFILADSKELSLNFVVLDG